MIDQLKQVIKNWESSGQGDRGAVNVLDAKERTLIIKRFSSRRNQRISFISGICWRLMTS